MSSGPERALPRIVYPELGDCPRCESFVWLNRNGEPVEPCDNECGWFEDVTGAKP